MPITRTVSDLQRNISEVYEVCQQTSEPVFITRNGRTEFVMMSAKTYEERTLLSQQVYEYEMDLKERLEQAYAEVMAGKSKTLEEIHREMGIE